MIVKGGILMDTRIAVHPILGETTKGREISFTFDGKEMTGYEGEAKRYLLCHRKMY